MDAGDLEIPPGDAALDAIVQGAAGVLASERRLLALGGDHAVTYPLVRAHAAHHPGLALEPAGPLHVSVDLDVLDPAFAPGVSHPEPGGPSTRDVIGFLQGLRGRVVGADVVELNPTRHPSGLTARVAAKIVKELVARSLEDESP